MNLSCENITIHWPHRRAPALPEWAPLTVTFASGTLSLITGPTGGGKSTFLHILAGLLRPTAGTVTADGDPVSRLPAPLRDQWRRQVGICFQHLHLPQALTATEAVLQPLVPRGLTWPAMIRAANQILNTFDLLSLADTPIRWLSGGQQQRTALARALVHQPRLILLDEPTAFQDHPHIRQLVRHLSTLTDHGVCVVVSSHDDRLVHDPAFHARYKLDQGRLERWL